MVLLGVLVLWVAAQIVRDLPTTGSRKHIKIQDTCLSRILALDVSLLHAFSVSMFCFIALVCIRVGILPVT